MCDFISAVKTKGKNGEDKRHFLTHDLIHNTPRGELLQKKYGGDDLIGHSVIREYFELRSGAGENWEQTDFSTPNNFPEVIVKALKKGEFKGFPFQKGLLINSLYDTYQDDRNSLDDTYQADLKPLYDKCWADRNSLYDKYQAGLNSLYDKYRADLKPLYDKYQDNVK